MCIEIGRTRELLDLAEKISNNPELVFSELFNGGVDEKNFLFMLNIDGKYFREHLELCLKCLPMFDGSILGLRGKILHVEIPPLKSRKYHSFFPEDKIIKLEVQVMQRFHWKIQKHYGRKI